MKNIIKKFGMASITVFLFSLLLAVTAFAKLEPKVDSSNKEKGLLVISITGTEAEEQIKGNKIAMNIIGPKGGTVEKYGYTIVAESITIPLVYGLGEYTVEIGQTQANGTRKLIFKEKIKVDKIDEMAMYTASVLLVNYTASEKAIKAFKEISDKKTKETEKIDSVFYEIINNYSYDNDKAKEISKKPPPVYYPVIDLIYNAKKGVCFDYASIFAGAMRNIGIPTRLVMGYSKDIGKGVEYHAWNEIYIDKKWIPLDLTYDAAVVKAKKKVTMFKDPKLFTIVNIF